MKSIFSQFFKSSLFNHVMRLAIVVVCLLFSATAAAWDTYYSKMEVRVAATGGGKVWVTNANNSTPNVGDYKDNAEGGFSSSTGSTNSTHTYYLYALASEGYSHYGWSTTENGNSLIQNSATGTTRFSRTINVTSKTESQPTTETCYAVFKSIIQCNRSTIGITKTADENTEPFSTTVYNAADFEIEVRKGDQLTSDLTCVVEKVDGVDATSVPATGEHIVEFKVTALQNAQKGDVFTITLTATNNSKHIITVNIYENIKITFKAPTVGKGSYTYLRGSDFHTKTFSNNSADTTIIMENADTYTLTADAESGYRFDRWVFAEQESTSENPYIYTTLDGDEISAEFVEDRYAMFMIRGQDGVYYNDLNHAIKAANGSGVVLVYQSGYLAAGEYDIPSGVTLLVPGDDAYTVSRGDVTINDFVSGATRTAIKCKKYLTMEDNTTITVKNGGAISVYAKMSKTQPMNGTPYSYGRMDMGKNCHITIESGGVLSALGYIIGNPETSSITAKAGALVYESFQIADWRGGNATVGMVGVDLNNLGALAGAVIGGVFESPGNEKDVFPAGQYFVQNIETKLILEYEAIEKLVTAVGLGSTFGDFSANAAFVVPDNATYSSGSGFFKIGQGTKLIKYYDRTEDRQKFIIEGTPGADSKARVDKIELVFPGISITVLITINFDMKISSSTFVLPVNNNMDVSITNTAVTASSRLAFMAGSTLSLDENSEFIVSQSQYLYDKDQNSYSGTDANGNPITIGYFGTGNSVVKTVPYTPGNTEYENDTYSSTAPKKRTAEKLTDARWLINGKVTINGGGVYTTSSGADITSDGNGKVYFGVKGTEAKTYQAYQVGNEISGWPEIAITNAQLHNDEVKNSTQPYSAGANVDANANPKETYTYIKSLGMWSLPQSLQISKVVGDSIVITLPKDTIQNVLCYVDTENKNVTENNFVVELAPNDFFTLSGNIVYDKTNEILTIPVKYTHKNRHNVGNPNIFEHLVVKCKDLTSNAVVYTEEIILKATEDYTPKFKVSINGTEYVNGSTCSLPTAGTLVNDRLSFPIVITADGNNVANAFATWTPATDVCAAPFEFTYGTKSTMPYASAKLVYAPKFAGAHEGALSITATYQDDAGIDQDTTVTITLKATANLRPNPLAFAEFPQPIYTTTSEFNLIDATTNLSASGIEVNPKTGIVTISGDGTNSPYKVKPNSLGIVTITATQEESQVYFGKTISKTIAVIDPNVYPIPFCIDEESGLTEFNKRLFAGTNVSYNTTNSTIDFNSTSSGSEWIFRFTGTPDKLTFTPTGNNTWNIQQRSSENAEWRNILVWSSLTSGEEVSYQLDPTTCQVRIQYGSNTSEVGTLTDVCVSELLISANTAKIYLPIYADETSEQTIVLTHTQNAIPIISLEQGLKYTAEKSDNLGTTGAPYYRTTVTISTTATTVENEYEFTATEDGNTVRVIVSAYNFPQELPIKLAEDDVERYHFITKASSYVQWDATNRQVVMQNPGSELVRSVTFAFNGAPSIVSFKAFSAIGEEIIVDSLWTVYESVDGTSGSFYPASLSRDSMNSNVFVQELNYTTRYVRINYAPVLLKEIRLSDFVIEGYPSVIVNPAKLVFGTENNDLNPKKLEVIAINLQEVEFEIDNDSAFQISMDTAYTTTDWHNAVTATETTHSNALGKNKVDTIFLGVKWLKNSALDEGTITIRNKKDNSVLAQVTLMGADGYLVKENAGNSGIYTGIPNGYTYHSKEYKDYKHHLVNLTNAFAEDGTALFDYLFIYGETTPAEGKDITAPKKGSADGSTNIGSNAVTPFYVYRKAPNSENQYRGYQYVGKIDNANTEDKAVVADIIITDTAGVVYIDATNPLRVYMTGFCPYATTGYTKNQEGVFLFRGKHGAKLDIYLEDFHVFSRNKTKNGNGFYGDKEGGEVFTDGYARGSGGVLVFENVDPQEQLQNYTHTPFEVSIHTIGDNLLSSNYGCFFGLSIVSDGPVGMKAYQVSSPIHIHMFNKEYVRKTKTRLNFDDVWPTAVDADNVMTDSIRTNGFLALKKQANNAPSIDMGNKHTEVNFKGGQVELQNSQIGSDTYKTTLAISHRSGYFGSDDAGIQLCYGIGTDSVGGTVNFLDGTVTVRPMYVSPSYRQYYLMDTLADGTMSDSTYCLRTPKNTYIRGGSVCRVRACQHVTSKGGAPKDRETGKFLGQYVYILRGNDVLNTTTKLAHIVEFPSNVEGLLLHHQNSGYTYGLNSVTPDKKNQFYFWIPDGMGGVTAEVDKYMSIWKACMTEIGAGIPGIEGRVGGDTPIEENEEVKYLMYCQIDKNIWDVITAGPKVGDKTDYTYQPPFEVPTPAKTLFNNETYARYDLLTYVSDSLQYQVTSDTAYTITDRVYYVTTATADVWQTFTAPFNVENIYVVESYSEAALEQIDNGNRTAILREQATHNADFAAFFAVAMAMGSDKDFDGIYQSYKKWAYTEDKKSGLYKGNEADYNLRSMQELVPYIGKNWREANFYLNHNDGNWGLTQNADSFAVKWNMLSVADTLDGILLHKGETYSLMFPYCPSCEASLENRDYWDYWSGKFLVFESTDGKQVINGRDFLNDTIDGNIFTQVPANNEMIVTGNSTFAQLNTNRQNVYSYNSYAPFMNSEVFEPLQFATDKIIYPTTAFLYGNVPTQNNMPARSIGRTGKINYGKENTPTDVNQGGNIPTVGGGNDLFITATVAGVNIAVAEPQHVRVMSATGAIIYSGMVQTAVDVALPATGVYVITGENEVHKILH